METIVEDYKSSSKKKDVQFKDQKLLWKKKVRKFGRKTVFKEEREKKILNRKAKATVRKEYCSVYPKLIEETLTCIFLGFSFLVLIMKTLEAYMEYY